jgi:hypothetical protein
MVAMEAVMTFAVLDPWIALAKEWQPLLAGVLAVVASIILAAGIIKAAKIREARSSANLEKPNVQDLRTLVPLSSIDTETYESINSNLENLRSLLRSALSSLSSTDVNDETARLLCTRIAAFQWKYVPLPDHADSRLRETYATYLNQFELLRVVLGKESSPSEASAILIQLNANARTLSEILKRIVSGGPETLARQNKN